MPSAVSQDRHSPADPPAAASAAVITVGICTFRRPELLRRLLTGVGAQESAGNFRIECVVVDNDSERSAAPVVEESQQRLPFPVLYLVETERNFARVRNRLLEAASGDYLAFIDDDEVPVPGWLARLLEILTKTEASGALGPVRPYFDQPPPAWLTRSRLCERPAHPTGLVLHWTQTRTGNVLLRRSIFDQGLRFDPVFRTGGEDVDFFKRAMAAGHRFVWCEEAPAYEIVPPERQRKSYFLRRALLQGQISARYSAERPGLPARLAVAAKALTALVVYAVALPIVALGGTHRTMRLLVKACHHLARFSSLAGIKLMKDRNL